MLKGKKIILGITGSIAAYKAAFLVRLLVKNGADVKVIMTPTAREFIAPLTLSTLSGHPVLIDLFQKDSGQWTNHVDLGLWADLMIVAPVTANTLAKMATGTADNLLLTVYLSARCPVILAPAMDMDMFLHPTTQSNLETLKENRNLIIDTSVGELASGLSGQGRMEEPEQILHKIVEFFDKKSPELPLKGKKILVTAGPTHEAIDPVRFVGNYSSGKMGVALADSLAARGAEVHLVAGPMSVHTDSISAYKLYNVTSAEEMYQKSVELFPEMDGAILSAAVSDFTPIESSDKKIKSKQEDLVIRLKPTKDIAAKLGQLKSGKQWLVGFALETHDEVQNAQDKLKKKNLDLIILNSLKNQGAGFGGDTNKISIIDRQGKIELFGLKSKTEVAKDIVDSIINLK
ncbi:MAG: bifunctional phosphopantothenoylcysteine decarboxylase/phosphopantothenate--cysteine ligase CoaBC [Bacteroidales bacterium]|nr:bifunctional phosphopantothenoylcysteine decarboxylase/phosphopantothenate--cysteine ligase CoaBC [Bacteroidales bacterium]